MYERNDQAITRRIAGETLLIPVTQLGVDLQKVYLLNDTATAIWAALEQPRNLEQLVADLLEQYEAEPEVLRQDVQAVLSELVRRGFVRTEGADG